MIDTGTSWRFAKIAFLSAVVAAAAPTANANGSGELDDVMHALASQRVSNAHFTEWRYLKMLTEPMKSTGTLAYVAPDRLEKVTLWPKHQLMVVDGDHLIMDPGPDGNPKALSLAAQPEVGAFVEAIRGTLAGDLADLERFYEVSFQGNLTDWALLLQPKGNATRKLLGSVVLKGQGPEIRTVEIKETDGDRTEMIILKDSK